MTFAVELLLATVYAALTVFNIAELRSENRNQVHILALTAVQVVLFGLLAVFSFLKFYGNAS